MNREIIMKCSSCNNTLLSEDNYTKFHCPSCMKSEIIRCQKCRLKSTIYVCPGCGFKGP